MFRRYGFGVVGCFVAAVGLLVGSSGASIATASSNAGSTDRVWLSVSSGGAHTCGIQRDHTLWCWGANNHGQLGVTGYRFSPAQVGTDTDWAEVAAGDGHTCGVRLDHTLWCWGANNRGQLGLGPHQRQDHRVPTHVGSGKNWASVATGSEYSCALRLDDSLWCWGSNQHYQLGLGDMTRKLRPTQVAPGTGWTHVSVMNGTHQAFACGVQTDGTLWCWGDNTYGQLGTGDTDTRSLPTQVGTDIDWDQVATGSLSACATRTDHSLWCWGNNSFGQLGQGHTGTRLTPTQVGAEADWAAMQLGGAHICATRTDRGLWCWGYNNESQLGLGDDINRWTPEQVQQGTQWSQVDGGDFYTCAVRARHTLWCWGYNNAGQLGLGDRTTRHIPTRV